jgi:hypothetical protein
VEASPFTLTPRIVVDADLHGARVGEVLPRYQHGFSQLTFTGRVLFRSSPDARAHVLAGGGLAVQRARSEFTLEPFGFVESTETVRVLHGRAGAEWDVSSRVMKAGDQPATGRDESIRRVLVSE